MESLTEALELANKENEDVVAELKDAEKCRDQALVKWEVVVIDDDDQDELE
jgi:hypothetical protein